MLKYFILIAVVCIYGTAVAASDLPRCKGLNPAEFNNCQTSTTNGFKYKDGIYWGEWSNGKRRGFGKLQDHQGNILSGEFIDDQLFRGDFTDVNGELYRGYFKNNKFDGFGILYSRSGEIKKQGYWEDGNFIRPGKPGDTPAKIKPQTVLGEAELQDIAKEKQKLAEERRQLEAAQIKRAEAKQTARLALDVSATAPDKEGIVTLTINSHTDTSSLSINGVEQGGRQDGQYRIKRVARVGAVTEFTVVAVDVYGNTDKKTIAVKREAEQTKIEQARLAPEKIKPAKPNDAVAIIIGIQNYKNVAKAEFADQDAQRFYDYAQRALGIKQENIKLLVNEQADLNEIVKAFRNWLPVKINKDKTDLYIFYSGHGLPSEDGKSLYLLPQGVDRDVIDKSAISQREVIELIQLAQPRAVTMFIDSCYSGQTRGGETLLASARPIALQTKKTDYPANFTVLTASAPDQISSSSPELQHGIFSFYLMKGLEGEADGNQDGKISAEELQLYLTDAVMRRAMTMNRKQQPQLFGNTNKLLVER